MSGFKPLTADEIPEDLSLFYDLATQRVETDGKGRRFSKVDRTCRSCGNRTRIRVSWIRSELRSGRITSICRTCNGHLYGDISPNWRGGRKVDRDGYVLVYKSDHSFSRTNGYVMEHRLVMEHQIGRYLLPFETVHHKNGKRDDNRPENLELRSGHHGSGARYEDMDISQIDSLVNELLLIRERKVA